MLNNPGSYILPQAEQFDTAYYNALCGDASMGACFVKQKDMLRCRQGAPAQIFRLQLWPAHGMIKSLGQGRHVPAAPELYQGGLAMPKAAALTVPVRMDTEIFRSFAVFDVFRRQRRWVRPLLFAGIFLGFAAVCFSQTGRREGAVLLGVTLCIVGLGMPAIYIGTYLHSVAVQARRMGLSSPKDVYRVQLTDAGLTVREAGRQDKADAAVRFAWDELHAAWRTPDAVYLYVTPEKAYLLPDRQIPGGADAAWRFAAAHLPKEKLHRAG